MLEIRLFATFRDGRGKKLPMEYTPGMRAQDVLDALGITPEEVAILLVNGWHSKPDKELGADDVISLFPPVGGG